jgi:hypothetical protein
MPVQKTKKVYGEADEVRDIAMQLIPTYHPELASATIRYIWVSEASKKNGKPLLAKASKVSDLQSYLIVGDGDEQLHFLMIFALDEWQKLDNRKRVALVDHMLEGCTGEEDEQNGDMKWTTRTPEVQEFTSILNRHGAWTEELSGMVEVANRLNLDARAQEVVDTIHNQEV